LIYRTNAIIALYISIFLPVMVIMVNAFQIFTSDAQATSVINYICLVVILGATLMALILFIVWEVRKHLGERKEEEKVKVPVDYSYSEEGNPEYVPYQVLQEYSVSHLTDIDLRDIGYMAGLCFFIFSECLSIHAVNLLRVDFAATVFYSSSISQIIYAQFAIILMFYLYTHCYLAVRDSQYLKFLFVAIFLAVALLCLVLGFLISVGTTTFKCVGGFAVAMLVILVALEVIKSWA
jgi:hypothetical protein